MSTSVSRSARESRSVHCCKLLREPVKVLHVAFSSIRGHICIISVSLNVICGRYNHITFPFFVYNCLFLGKISEFAAACRWWSGADIGLRNEREGV